MGFYGNITNVNKSTFQFDKIYANRAEMDAACESDGVFIGRYVLVDYDKASKFAQAVSRLVEAGSADFDTVTKSTTLIPGYIVSQNWDNVITLRTGIGYESSRFLYTDDKAQVSGDNVTKGSYVLVLGRSSVSRIITDETLGTTTEDQDASGHTIRIDYVDNDDYVTIVPELWRCVGPGSLVEEGGTVRYATFVQIDWDTDLGEDGDSEGNDDLIRAKNYTFNYNTDLQEYNNFGRGWDSTVWQKTYKNGVAKYVMIAELNSVVPSFGLVVDSPTETPLKPHFDTDSSNVYYKMHLQPAWGVRLKGKYNGTYTTDSYIYPSDVNGSFTVDSTLVPGSTITRTLATWEKDDEDDYELNTHVVETTVSDYTIDDTMYQTPLAVYFNKAGFDPYRGSDAFADIDAQSANKETIGYNAGTSISPRWKLNDNISFRPTGKSENEYYQHIDANGNYVTVKAPDTYELSIMLPSIGQSMSDMWDMVYGKSRLTDIQGRYLWHPETNVFAAKGNLLRNSNIDWNTTNGIRAVYKDVYDGTTKYDKESLSTMAGIINTAHDLMGMIIKDYHEDDVRLGDFTIDPTDEAQVATWDPSKIYYAQDGKFYKKYKTYEFTPAMSGSVEYPNYKSISLIDLTETADRTYTKDDGSTAIITEPKYYVESWEQFPVLEGEGVEGLSESKYSNYIALKNVSDFKEGMVIGTLNIANKAEALNVGDYLPGTYFYSDVNHSYYVQDTSLTPQNQRYYRIGDLERGLDPLTKEIYTPNRYYIATYEVLNNGQKLVRSSQLCTQASLDAAISSFLGSLNNGSNAENIKYTFYKNTSYSTDTTGQSETNIVYTLVETDEPEKKLMSLPTNTSNYSITYDNGIPKKIELFYGEPLTLIETIGDESDEDPSVDIVVNEEGFVTGYFAKQYAVQDEEKNATTKTYPNIYTAWEAAENGITIDKNKVAHVIRVVGTPATDQIIFSAENEVPADKLINYDENIYSLSVVDGVKRYTKVSQSSLNTVTGRANNTLDSSGHIMYYQLKLEGEDKNVYVMDNFYNTTIGLYYKTADDDWIRETLIKAFPEKGSVDYYYRINSFNKVTNAVPYESNKYYIKSGDGTYELVTSENKPTGSRTYYERVDRYVISDVSGLYAPGMLWNEAITTIPEGLILGTRKEKWVAKEIKDYSQRYTTMNGLILRNDNMLLEGDELTRDQNTVQGSINVMNDIVSRFDTLDSKEFVIVDEYGRIHSADFDTNQSGSYINVGKTSANGDIDAQDDAWIKIALDDDKDNPHIKVEHQLKTVVSDTTTIANKNTSSGDGLNKGNGDTLKLYTPIVDSMGHVIGKNTETVTLPYGFKIASIGEESAAVVDVASVSENIVADSTQDTITINPGNKWVKLAATANSDTLTIGHLVGEIDITDSANTNINNNGNVVNIPDIEFDEAGHITAKHSHNYTLPYGFKTISTNGRSDLTTGSGNTEVLTKPSNVIADSTQDTLGIDSGNEWIKITTDTSNDKVIISHDVKITSSTTSSANLSTATAGTTTFEVISYDFDSTNHFISKDTKTLTMPNSYGKFTGDNGSTEAGATHDSLSVTGDTWITSVASAGNIALAHAAPHTVAERSVSNITPSFGDTFTVEDWRFDTKGHQAGLQTHTVRIPDVTLVNGTVGNVLTSLSVGNNASTFNKEITLNNSYVGSLTLNGYELSTTPSNEQIGVLQNPILATDTVNGAFEKLQYQLNTEITNRTNAVDNLINGSTVISYTPLIDNPENPGEQVEGETVEMSITQMIAKIIELENKIAVLEGGGE